MKTLRKLFYRTFKRYVIIQRGYFSYETADRLICETGSKPERDRWVLDTALEDHNFTLGFVYLCRRERITE